MRICGKCKVNPCRNKTSSYCKDCHNEYQKAFYKRKPQSTRDSTKKRHDEIRRLIKKAKDKPCADCGNSYPYYVMDFDHVRGEKKFNLSVAARHYKSFQTLQEEIDKCEVVCANCHRERTFSRINSPVV